MKKTEDKINDLILNISEDIELHNRSIINLIEFIRLTRLHLYSLEDIYYETQKNEQTQK